MTPTGVSRSWGSTFGEPRPCVLLGATRPPSPLAWDKSCAPGKGGTPCFCIGGLQALLTMNVVMLWVWVALLGLLRWPGHGVWLPCLLLPSGAFGLAWLSCPHQGSGSGWCTQDCVLVCDLFVSFIHLGALFAVGNSFRQFLLLLLMLTMVGTCLLLACISAQPRSRGRLCVQPTTRSGPLAFPV